MLQYFLQNNFPFLLFVLIRIYYCNSLEHLVEENADNTELKRKCAVEYCKCAEIGQWNGVVCKEYYTTQPDIHFNSFKYLPGRFFVGVSIRFITVRDSDLTVDENVFEGMLSLERFEVSRSRIEVVPDFRFVKSSIEEIKIISSRLTSLEGKHLQNLIKVKLLSFRNNYIHFIDPDVFKGTEGVSSLHLDNNLLTYMPPKLLHPMKNLYQLTVSHNNLLHVDGLFSTISRPRVLNLSFNNITNFNLTQIFNLTIEDTIFLGELDLSYNLIKETSFSLAPCKLSPTNQDDIFKFFHLRLSGNQLLHLNDCLRCLQVYYSLEVHENQIQFLTEKDFISANLAQNVKLLYIYKPYPKFPDSSEPFNQSLLLRRNQIRRIDTNTFKPIRTMLVLLDLSSNQIASVNGSVRHLSRLTSLNLSYNSIQIIAENEFDGLYNLSELLLQHNFLKAVVSLHHFQNLKVLNIAHNNITSIKKKQIPIYIEQILLADNSFKCACHLLPFIDFLKERQEQKERQQLNFETDANMCLRSDLESSRRKQSNCPDACSCRCTDYEDESFMLMDCSSRNLSLVPQLLSRKLTILKDEEKVSSDDQHHLLVQDNINSDLQFEDGVLGINFENNNLELLDAALLPPNLTLLYLRNNKLRMLPDSIFENQRNLKQVSLSGNPWNCDCGALKFKRWLTSNSRIVTDYNNILCGVSAKEELAGSVIWKLKDLDLCPETDLGWILSMSLGILASLSVCLTARILYMKYELNIHVFLYSRGFTFMKKEIHHKPFDAFVSFCNKDDEFVIKHIISEIEKRNPNICLCLHYRHFKPGELITNNITRAVQSSSRTVFILSRNFLESEWCLLEFETAHLQTLLDKVHRVIVVKLEELPKEIDPTIKVYLKSTTYLTWGESDFWNKLLYVLPSQTNVRTPVTRFVEESETIFR